MPFTFVQNARAQGDAGAITIAVSLTGVGAGNLIVLWVAHEGAATTYSCSDGTTTLTNGTVSDHANGDQHALFCYVLSANGGNQTYTMTFGGSRTFRRMQVWEFSYSGTVSLDAQGVATGTNGTHTSGAITTTGTDEVVLGGSKNFNTGTFSSFLINGVTADGSLEDATTVLSSSWYRLLTAIFTSGVAAVSHNNSTAWNCHIIAFKAAAAAVTPQRTLMGVGT